MTVLVSLLPGNLRGVANGGFHSSQLTEADMQDPDLLGELGEVAGDVDFESAPEIAAAAGGSVKGGGPEVGGYDDDEEGVEPDRPNEEEELNEEDLLAMGDDAADVQEEVRRMMVRAGQEDGQGGGPFSPSSVGLQESCHAPRTTHQSMVHGFEALPCLPEIQCSNLPPPGRFSSGPTNPFRPLWKCSLSVS